MPAKWLLMDVFPTSLLKSCLDTAPLITQHDTVFRGGLFSIEVQDCISHSTSKMTWT